MQCCLREASVLVTHRACRLQKAGELRPHLDAAVASICNQKACAIVRQYDVAWLVPVV